jgi:lysophospholipase L1-like esterase
MHSGGRFVERREFVKAASTTIAGTGRCVAQGAGSAPATAFANLKDYSKESFKRLVIMGESTVQGGAWLERPNEERYADVVAKLISECQGAPIEYFNKGIGANAISPRSPGYEKSAKPSALERYKSDVVALRPDLFILAYGLNDMRAGMPIGDFRQDMATIIRDVKQACSPVTVLTTIYYMTGWKSYPPYDKGSLELTLKYNQCIRTLARELDCVVADPWSAEGGADWLIHFDGVHANKVGNLLIGHRIFEAIAQHASGITNGTFARGRNTHWTRNCMALRAKVGDPFRKTW